MTRVLITLLLLLASVWLGVVIIQHPGSAYFIAPPWSVEMPLWFFGFIAIISLLIFYFLLSTMHALGFSWYRVKNWWHSRSEHRSYSKTQQGLLALVEREWEHAELLLRDGAIHTSEPLINYLGAARAAFAQQAYDRCEKLLQKAHQVAPQAEVAIGIMQAQFQMQRDQLEQALATLNHLRQLAPKHPYVLTLLERVYTRLADWQDLLALVPYLRQAKVVTKDQSYQLEKNIYCALFQRAAAKNLTDLTALWQTVPRNLQKNPDIVLAYVIQLQRFPEQVLSADALLRAALRKNWSLALVQEYGKLRLPDPSKQLATAEAWLSHHGSTPELYFVLGEISLRCQLWGKAKDYYQQGLAQKFNAQASLAYGKLLVQLGERDEALKVYQQGLAQLS